MHGLFLAWRSLEQDRSGRGVPRADPRRHHPAPGGPRDLQVVPRFIGQVKRDRLAGEHVAIPVREVEIIAAAGEPRAVVDAGPGGFADAVAGLPPPAFQIVGIVDLDLAHGRRGGGQGRRGIVGAVPSVAPPPFGARAIIGEVARRQRRQSRHGVAAGQRRDRIVRQRAVVDADLVHVAAADEVVVALHLPRADDARVRAELVEAGIEQRALLAGGGEFSVHVETDPLGLIPGQREVRPGFGLGKRLDRGGHADASEPGVGDKRVEAVAVVVDAQPDHVPARMIGESHAEDGELGGADRIPGAPEECQRAALGIDVARRPPRQALEVAAPQPRSPGAIRDHGHLGVEIRCGRAGRGKIRGRALRGGQVEQQAGLGGRCHRGGRGQRQGREGANRPWSPGRRRGTRRAEHGVTAAWSAGRSAAPPPTGRAS